jgi:hypothetical protein
MDNGKEKSKNQRIIRRKKKDSIDEVELTVLERNRNPAKAWVNLLLLHILKNDLGTFTLEKSKGIPAIPLEEEVPDGELSFEGIINRLKIMSGLDPIKYKDQQSGSIQIGFGGLWYIANTIFNDSSNNPSCSITLSTEGKRMS